VNGGILLVTDSEIKTTCKLLFEKGLKVELSGCAALAALLHNKIPDLKNQKRPLKIVVILSGGNITASELSDLMSQ
jgi:threonine dehydratase